MQRRWSESGAIDLIVVDSVAALVPRAEIEGEMGDAHMGLQARLMSQALRKLTAAISKSQTTVIFINQIRMKIGVMFGNPETTTGGNALKFYSSVRLDIRRIESIKDGQDVTGSRVRVKVVKNKMAPPFKQAEFDIMFAEGISKTGELVDMGVEKRVVDKAGAWYSYKAERLGQGREAVRDFLRTNAAIAKEIEQKFATWPVCRSRERQEGRGEGGQGREGEDGNRKAGTKKSAATGLESLHRCRSVPKKPIPDGVRRQSRHYLDLAVRYLARTDRTSSPGRAVPARQGREPPRRCRLFVRDLERGAI